MSTVLSQTTYSYDKAHNRVQKVKDGKTTNYSYNNLNQLTGFTEGLRQVSFSYDANGNRKQRAEGGVVDSYGYDYENRLVTLQKGGVPYAYTYDYRTRRVERVEGSTATKVVFSGGTSVQEYEGTNKTVEYVRGSDFGGGIGGILYTLRPGDRPSYTHYNNRGDVVAKTDADQALTYQAEYEAFGTRTKEVGQTQDRQKANTKDEDPTGLLNEGFRYRDLETGSFITRDPLGFVDGPNLYTYVQQNPWTHFDPEGLSFWSNAKAFAYGAVKGAVIAGLTVGAIAAVAAVAPAIAVGGAVVLGVVGVAGLAVSGYEIATGKEAFTGKQLSAEERSQKGGEIAGGLVGGGAVARATGLAGKLGPGFKKLGDLLKGGSSEGAATAGNTTGEAAANMAARVNETTRAAATPPENTALTTAADSAKTSTSEVPKPGMMNRVSDWWSRGSEKDPEWRALSPMDKLYWEIGQKTLKDPAKIPPGGPVEAGKTMVKEQGWPKALFPEAPGLKLGLGDTFETGPTAAGRYYLPRGAGLAGAGGVSRTVTPEKKRGEDQ